MYYQRLIEETIALKLKTSGVVVVAEPGWNDETLS